MSQGIQELLDELDDMTDMDPAEKQALREVLSAAQAKAAVANCATVTNATRQQLIEAFSQGDPHRRQVAERQSDATLREVVRLMGVNNVFVKDDSANVLPEPADDYEPSVLEKLFGERDLADEMAVSNAGGDGDDSGIVGQCSPCLRRFLRDR